MVECVACGWVCSVCVVGCAVLLRLSVWCVVCGWVCGVWLSVWCMCGWVCGVT